MNFSYVSIQYILIPLNMILLFMNYLHSKRAKEEGLKGLQILGEIAMTFSALAIIIGIICLGIST